MDLSCTPRAKFPRKKFISRSTAAPYRSPIMHNSPVSENNVELHNTPEELKGPLKTSNERRDGMKEKVHQAQQKFVSPVATSSPYRSPFAQSMPMEKKVLLPSENISSDELKSSILELLEKNEVLKEKIHYLEQKGLKEEELKWHIDKLHRYNEVKDIAQTVMERLAILEQKTMKEVYEDFNLTNDD